MSQRMKILAVSLAFVAILAVFLIWKLSNAFSEATAKSHSAELQRLSGLLGVQFADTTELVRHGDGGDRTGKYYNWFVRDLGTTNELRSRFAKLGEEIPSFLGDESAHNAIAVGMSLPESDAALAFRYRWENPGVQYRVTLYSVDGSDWAKIMSFR